jgi:hypothetical protein
VVTGFSHRWAAHAFALAITVGAASHASAADKVNVVRSGIYIAFAAV